MMATKRRINAPIAAVFFTIALSANLFALTNQSHEKKTLLRYYPPQALLNEVVAFQPVHEYHINAKAPNSCGGGTTIKISSKQFQCQFTSAGRFSPRIYVCNDANTLCVIEKAKIKVKTGYKTANSTYHPQGTAVSPNPRLPGFIQDDIPKARALAKKEKKPILLFFTQLYCPPCNLLEETSLNTPDFRKLTSGLIRLQIDADIDNWPPEIEKLDMLGTPTFVLFNDNFREIARTILYGSPYFLSRWIKRELRFVNAPISGLKRRFAADPSKMSTQDLQRIGSWYLAQEDYRDAKKTLSYINKKDARIEYLTDLAATGLAKGDDYLQLARKASSEAPDCRETESLWGMIPANDKKISLKTARKEARIINRAIARARSQERINPYLRWDCDLTRANLFYIKAMVYRGPNPSKADKAFQQASDLYGKFEALTQNGKGMAPKMLQATMWDDAHAPEKSEHIYDELNAADPKNYSFDYLKAGGLSDRKDYDAALKVLTLAAKKAKGNEWLQVQRRRIQILVDAGRKSEAQREISSLLAQIHLPRRQPSAMHRFVAFLREMQGKIDSIRDSTDRHEN